MNHPELTPEFKKELEAFGCFDIKVIEGLGICALKRFAFTTGLLVGIDEFDYNHRYCYPIHADAIEDFKIWDGIGAPSGQWIKRKGNGDDLSNPNYIDNR